MPLRKSQLSFKSQSRPQQLRSPLPASFFTACKNAEAIEASLFARGIARTDPSGGGVALVFPAAPRPPSDPTRVARSAFPSSAVLGATQAPSDPTCVTRTAFPPRDILGATRASVPPNVSPALAPCVHKRTVFRLATQARALLPDLPPLGKKLKHGK